VYHILIKNAIKSGLFSILETFALDMCLVIWYTYGRNKEGKLHQVSSQHQATTW